jgi:hypothetical protein
MTAGIRDLLDHHGTLRDQLDLALLRQGAMDRAAILSAAHFERDRPPLHIVFGPWLVPVAVISEQAGERRVRLKHIG